MWLLCVVLLWRGEAAGNAVWPGLLHGGAPLLVPLLGRAAGGVCPVGWMGLVCMASCVGGGIVAGALLSRRGIRAGEERVTWWICVSLVTALTGSLGCAWAGASGLLGMLAGLLVGAFPVVAGARLRRS